MLRKTLVPALAAALTLASAPAPSFAQSTPTTVPEPRSGAVIDGPPAPIAPKSITRDEQGHATVRSIRLLAPLVVDGKLEEDVYTQNEPFGDLIQVVPATGKPAM